jgi:hypothetical protein
MKFQTRHIFHDASHLLLAGILPESVTGDRKFETFIHNNHMIGGITLKVEKFIVGVNGSHNKRLHAIF